MSRATLFLDVDDTIIANCYQGSGFDLRPGVYTQIRGLTRLFNCVWLTMWKRKDIFRLTKDLYGSALNEKMTYADWELDHPWRKAGYVLNPKRNQNFWWLEDPLTEEEIAALVEHNKLDRYVRVEPYGSWGFLEAVNELFKRAGIGANDLKRVGIKPEWYQKEAILNQEGDKKENFRETLLMLKGMVTTSTATAEVRLKAVETYIETQLTTMY